MPYPLKMNLKMEILPVTSEIDVMCSFSESVKVKTKPDGKQRFSLIRYEFNFFLRMF